VFTAGETKIIGLLTSIKENQEKSITVLGELNSNIVKLFSLMNTYNDEYQEMVHKDLKDLDVDLMRDLLD
jgi:hypothetical protein